MVFLFLISTAFAQEAKIDIEHIGYGKRVREVHFSIHNTGSVPITDVTVYVDGNLSQTIRGRSSPGRGFEITLYLDSGEHFIEVKTPEGAYDSLNMTISSTKEKPVITPPEEVSFLEKNRTLIIIGILLLVIMTIWLLVRKPKIRL